jgi:O-antigen ligase
VIAFCSIHADYFSPKYLYDFKRILQIALCLFSLPILFLEILQGAFVARSIEHRLTVIVLSCFLFVGLFSALGSAHFGFALLDWLHVFFLCVLFYCLWVATEKDRAGFKIFVVCLMLSVGLLVTKFFTVYVLATLDGGATHADLLFVSASNRNFIGQYLAVCCCFSLVLGFSLSTSRYRILCLFVVFLGIGFLVKSDVRGAIVAILIASVFALLFRRLGFRFFLLAFSFVGLASLLIFFIESLNPQAGLLAEFGSASSVRERVLMWVDCLHFWQDRFLLGIGPGHFAVTDLESGVSRAHPHNFYLQLLAEWGSICFVLLASVFFIFVKRLYSKRKELSDPYALGALLAVVCGMMHAGVSGVLVMPLSQLIFVFFLAVSLSGSDGDVADAHFNSVLSSRPAMLAIVAFVCLLFALLCYMAYTYKWRSDENCMVRQGPRYWQAGGVLPCD